MNRAAAAVSSLRKLNGDRMSFESDLLAILPRLRRFAASLSRDRADADDLCQAALEKALRARDQWQPGTRLDSRTEEHTSELQSLMRISYAVFCVKKQILQHIHHQTTAITNP